ncbi:hypothetical protein Tco_0265689 [Tanacetum coccineum]
MKWVPKVRNETVPKRVSYAIDTIVQLILFIVDSGCTKHMTGNLSLLCNFVEKYLGTVRFGNDQFALILGYGDLVQGNIMIKRVYYVEGLNHNLFSVGQFCDADLEVAFRKSTCFVRDLQGNDFLTGNRGTDLYTISLQETSSSIQAVIMLKLTNSCRVFKKKESEHQASTPRTLNRCENLDKRKEIRDPAFCGILYSVKGISCLQQENKGLVPQRQKASDYDNPDPAPEHTNLQEVTESSSRNIGTSYMSNFNQPQDSEYQWTKDHPLNSSSWKSIQASAN